MKVGVRRTWHAGRDSPVGPPAIARSDGEVRWDVARTPEALEALRAEWERLHSESPHPNPFLSYEWVRACSRHLYADRRLFVVTARRGGRLVGVAPLRICRHAGFRVLRLAGEGHSPYGGWLVEGDGESLLLQSLQAHSGEWDLLLLYQLAAPFSSLHTQPLPAGLRGGVRKTRWRGAAYYRHPGAWEQAVADGPGWLKETRRKAARLERQGVVLERLTGNAAVERLPDVDRVETLSWQGQYGRSHDPAERARVMGLLREGFLGVGAHCEMELWLASRDGTAAAYCVNLLLPDRLWLYRGAYDEGQAALGAGTVLDWLAIRRAWAEGRREFDYMSGDERYKAERTDSVRPLFKIAMYPATPRGRLAYAALIAPREALEGWEPASRALAHVSRAVRSPGLWLPGRSVRRDRIR